MKKLLMMLVLAGCVTVAGPPRPEAVRLTDRDLVLSLSDGTRCTALWAAAPVGRLDGCGPGYGYAVTVEDNPNILRQLVEGIVLALGGDGILAPMAEVVITDATGRDHVFVSPPPVDLSDD